MIAFMGLKFMYVSTVNKFLNSCNSYDYVKDTKMIPFMLFLLIV